MENGVVTNGIVYWKYNQQVTIDVVDLKLYYRSEITNTNLKVGLLIGFRAGVNHFPIKIIDF